MDHPLRLDRDLARRLRRIDGQGLEEISGMSHFAESTEPGDSAEESRYRYSEIQMAAGAWQRASEWLPAEFAAAEARESEEPRESAGKSVDPEDGPTGGEAPAGSDLVP
jgi:hypothetical protein